MYRETRALLVFIQLVLDQRYFILHIILHICEAKQTAYYCTDYFLLYTVFYTVYTPFSDSKFQATPETFSPDWPDLCSQVIAYVNQGAIKIVFGGFT